MIISILQINFRSHHYENCRYIYCSSYISITQTNLRYSPKLIVSLVTSMCHYDEFHVIKLELFQRMLIIENLNAHWPNVILFADQVIRDQEHIQTNRLFHDSRIDF